MSTLKDKVVLITGASSGFGAAAAKQFAQEGCKIILAARRIDRLEDLANQIYAGGGDAMVGSIFSLIMRGLDGSIGSKCLILSKTFRPKLRLISWV
jgi:NAD(P)-dependent dehydrogenase (short-subunit alcohol dehydrogenase family)